MKNYPVKGISPLSNFSETVYLDRQYIIAALGTPVTQETISALSEWGFADVLCDGEPAAFVPPSATQTAQESRAGDLSSPDFQQKKQEVENFYAMLIKFVEKLFSDAAKKNKIRFDMVLEKVKSIYGFIRENRRFMMQVMPYTKSEDEKNHVATHSAHAAVIAIDIGTYLKLPQYQRIELGVAALVHDIGRIMLPPELYEDGKVLTEAEKKLIYTHPIHSYNIIKTSNFPPLITAAVIAHHEREDGLGYPRKLAGERISLYARIIAAASTYEELTAKRPRSEAQDGYTETVELLRNKEKVYDETVIKALVNSLSEYPIGSYVLLSDGNTGRVIDVNPDDRYCPVVEIITNAGGGKNVLIRTSPGGIFVVSSSEPKEPGKQ